MHREGLVHSGFDMLFNGQRHRIDLNGLTGGCFGNQNVPQCDD
jgi:p-hydroxybenzoate 3-monooxygenase